MCRSPARTSSRSLQLLFAGIFIYLSEKGASLHLDAERIITLKTLLCIWAVCGPPSSKNQTKNALQEITKYQISRTVCFCGPQAQQYSATRAGKGFGGAMFLLTVAGYLLSRDLGAYFCAVPCGWDQCTATMSKLPQNEILVC